MAPSSIQCEDFTAMKKEGKKQERGFRKKLFLHIMHSHYLTAESACTFRNVTQAKGLIPKSFMNEIKKSVMEV